MYNGHLRNHDCWQHTSNSTPTTPPTWKGQEKTNEERIKKPIKNRGKRNDIRLRTFYAAAYKKSKLVIMFTIITVRSATNGNLRRWHYEDEEQDAKALYAYFPYENDVYLLLGHTRLLPGYNHILGVWRSGGECRKNWIEDEKPSYDDYVRLRVDDKRRKPSSLQSLLLIWRTRRRRIVPEAPPAVARKDEEET